MNGTSEIATPDCVDLELLRALDSAAESIRTPCGTGQMVWRRWGNGAPLLLLHGGYGSWRHWVRTILALKEERTLYVPDIPGLGDSAEAPEPAIPATIAAVISAGLERLGIATATLDLVGFSFGSLVGSYLAARSPPLNSLTLVGPGAFGQARNNVELLRVRPDMPMAEQRTIHRENLGRLMIADPAKIDGLAVTIQQINVALARVKSRRFAKTDSVMIPLGMAQPRHLNVVWGAKDAVSAPHFDDRIRLLRSIRPDVSVHLVPDAGHWVAYEDPASFNALLRQLPGLALAS